jgi:hypothetical protein
VMYQRTQSTGIFGSVHAVPVGPAPEAKSSYVRQGFFYGREFLNDADMNAQVLSWTAQKANARVLGPPHESLVYALSATSARC